MAKALDPTADREDAIVSLPEDRIVRNFRGQVAADYSTPEGEYRASLFPLSQVFDCSSWRTGYSEWWDYDKDKMRFFDAFEKDVIKRFEQYQVPVITLRRETPKEAVCQVFEKVNTGGVSLTVFELLTATYAADSFSLRDDWAVKHRELRSHPIAGAIQNTDFLQAVSLLATYARKQQDPTAAVSCKRREVLGISLDDYQTWSEPAMVGFRKAARFLIGEGVFASRDLPYRTQMVPLAVVMAILGGESEHAGIKTQLSRWYWSGVFGEIYGSAAETQFARDVPEVVSWIRGGQPPSAISGLSFSANRLLTLRTRNSAAYKGLACLILRNGGCDFRTGESTSVQTYYEERIDVHHIFPKSYSVKAGIDPILVDSIVNKTPISATTNRIIGGNAPSEYLERIQKTSRIKPEQLVRILSSHLIDYRPLVTNDFATFFANRRAAILQCIEGATGVRIQDDSTHGIQAISDEEEEDLDEVMEDTAVPSNRE